MKTAKTLSISEARKDIFNITDQASRPGNHITLTENGRPKVVMMSAEEFESWEETLEVERIFPDLDKDIARVEKDIKSGAYKKYATLEDILVKEGFVLADKSKKKYGVSAKPGKPGKKGSR